MSPYRAARRSRPGGMSTKLPRASLTSPLSTRRPSAAFASAAGTPTIASTLAGPASCFIVRQWRVRNSKSSSMSGLSEHAVTGGPAEHLAHRAQGDVVPHLEAAGPLVARHPFGAVLVEVGRVDGVAGHDRGRH